MRKVIIFGASVTAQSKGSGYANFLPNFLNLNSVDVVTRGYGACHFDDAGFFLLQDILKLKPDYIVFEWNTTGLDEFNARKLVYVISALSELGVGIGFLILPRKDKNVDRDRPCETQVKELCASAALPLLDIRNLVNVEHCLRDVVHTNEQGALEYARHIATWIMNSLLVSDGRHGLPQSLDDTQLSKAKPTAISGVAGLRLGRKFLLAGEVDSDYLNDVAFSIIVGPHSPILDVVIYSERDHTRKIGLFDAWCDFEREMTISLWPKDYELKVGSSFVLEACVSDAVPNYSVCRKPGFSYTGSRYVDLKAGMVSGLLVNSFFCR